MSEQALIDTARALVSRGKGLLAMDESSPTCDKRFAAAGISQTEEARRSWRELLVTAPQLNECVSGAILFDETLHQRDSQGVFLVNRLVASGIIPGIKVDLGAKPMALHPGETITEGLDGLRLRLRAYAGLGARFAKWRAVISLPDGHPSHGCIEANAETLARYAALCQEAGLVPIVEPEVLMAGDHSLARCGTATDDVLHAVFEALHTQGVLLEGVILKPNMVLAGLDCSDQPSVQNVAESTLRCLLRSVPAAVAGIAFLSGGQSGMLASARLNAIVNCGASPLVRAPWPLVFSYARALQQPALAIWRGHAANVAGAQAALLHRARCNRAALHGNYHPAMEEEPALLMAS